MATEARSEFHVLLKKEIVDRLIELALMIGSMDGRTRREIADLLHTMELQL